MEAVIFALISYLGWGSGDIFGTIASRKIGAYSTTFWVFVAGAVLFSLYIPFALNDISKINFSLLLTVIVLGFFYIAGNVAFNEAVRLSNASLVGTIAGSFTAVTLLISVLFLGEKINTNQIIAVIIVFAGVTLSTINFAELKTKKIIQDKGVLLSLFSMIAWGGYFALIKAPVREIGWFWPTYIAFWLFPFIYLYMSKRKIKLVIPDRKKVIPSIVASTFLLRSGDLAFNIALNKGLTTLVAPIGGAYPTLFVILAFLAFKDPIKRQQVLGIVTTLIGIVLLSIFST